MNRIFMRAVEIALCSALLVEGQLAGATEQSDETTILQPAGKWNIDYTDDSCRLGRRFGQGDEQMFFYAERFEPADSMLLVVAGKSLGNWRNRTVDLQFGPGGTALKDRGLGGEYGKFGPAVMLSSVTIAPPAASGPGNDRDKAADAEASSNAPVAFSSVTPEQERSIEWLDIKATGRKRVRLALGPMDKPLAAMRACTDELITHWGLDLAAVRGMTRQPSPKGNPGDWVTSNDYPRGAINRGTNGLVYFRLIVGAEGKPQSCHIQQATDPAIFGETVCKAIMQRARFEPALGPDGQPITSYWRSSVNFITF